MSAIQPKYSIGQEVRFMGDSEAEAGVVVSYSFDGESFAYQISSVEVDTKAKKLIKGIKHCREEELIAIEKE